MSRAATSQSLVFALSLACLAGCAVDRSGLGVDDGSVPDAPADRDIGCRAADDCDDGNPCTTGRCTDNQCEQVPNDGAPCDDGVFCNGADTCAGDTCSEHDMDPPCEGSLTCDPELDTCVGCTGDSDCPDDVTGDWGDCGFDGICDETGTQDRTLTTFDCSDDGTCEMETSSESRDCSRDTDGTGCGDGTFCNGMETCEDGSCVSGPEPCSDSMCDESADACTGCTTPDDCDDGMFCNGVEGCESGTCTGGADPCGGLACNEDADECGECFADGDCSSGVCDPSTNTCVECVDNGDCTGSCSKGDGTCTEPPPSGCTGGLACQATCEATICICTCR